jgi:hypothetical protein
VPIAGLQDSLRAAGAILEMPDRIANTQAGGWARNRT